ncbi:hypothetical protein [Candidatus Deferrimicrobium sp.]|uniref:DUF1156 domain-containing protein n=1 Tax=Candidatus Deferrimicrobium sp. TaxID=3060586 RepID=UPI002ED31432
MDEGIRLEGGFNCDRAFKRGFRDGDLKKMRDSSEAIWGSEISVIDPMSGGGSIPLESARLGFHTLANEYNPVACSVLEATVDYPFRFGEELGRKVRKWAKVWNERIEKRLARFFPSYRFAKVHAYIFTRTVPCPDTHIHTPLVPDWHLLKPKKESGQIVSEPVVDRKNGTWTVRVAPIGRGAGQIRQAPPPTYDGGKGVSLFSGQMVDGVWAGRQIPADYIKAKALAGEMKSCLYAVALKAKGLTFQPPESVDLKALNEAEKELARLRPDWEKRNVIPTERIPIGDKTGEPMARGITSWADMFSPRQLLCFGVLVEELRSLRSEIVEVESKDAGEAVIHLLAFAMDKLMDYSNSLNTWESQRGTAKHLFQRHDLSFKATYAEMAPCGAGTGLEWAIENVLKAYEEICALVSLQEVPPVEVFHGSASSLPQVCDKSITAIVVDPPYADNVQYSELADFFYVWLKRTQGHRRPEWFSTNLCEHDQEAVVNISRHRENGGAPGKRGKRDGSAADAKAKAHSFYQSLMTDVFRESRRILRDDGVLTVMFTHKKQEAWEALFSSLLFSSLLLSRPGSPLPPLGRSRLRASTP